MAAYTMAASQQPAFLLRLPIELLESIGAELDICSLWNLLDSCTHCRYSLLASTRIWKRLVFLLDIHGLHAVYAALRRFRDDNGHGLRQLVEEVVMDGTDDSMISPLVMLVKFPRLRILSAKHRRFNTNLQADTKLLRDFLMRNRLKGITLERYSFYHHYMDTEPHMEEFHSMLESLCETSGCHDDERRQVQLDIKRCADPSTAQRGRFQDLELRHGYVDMEQVFHHPETVIDDTCRRIVSKDAKCWVCDAALNYCWHCQSHCPQCRSKRLSPLANDTKRKQKLQLGKRKQLLPDAMDQELQEQFRLFE